MKKLIKVVLSLTIIISSFLLTSCNKSKTSSTYELDNTKPTVAVSIVPEETFVRAVSGNLVNIVTMIPPGESPENFEPTPDLLQKFSNSKIYFSINVPTEINSIIPKVNDFNKDVKIVNLANEVKKAYPEREFSPGNRDPHIWLSPKRAQVMINIIKTELSILDPTNKDIYTENAKKYIKKIDSLDLEIKNSLKHIKNKSIIVYHPAFGYFANDYDLEMIALEHEGKEANPQDIQETVDFAKKKNIKTIFYQTEIDSKQSQTLADEIGGKAEGLAPLAPNYIENLKKISNSFLRANKKPVEN